MIVPVFRDLVRRLDPSIAEYRTAKPLVRHSALLDVTARETVQTLTRRHEALRAVVEFRERSQAMWDGAPGTEESALWQLRQLCTSANESPVAALRAFSRRLQMYRPRQ